MKGSTFEEAPRSSHMCDHERLSEHTRRLSPLAIGDAFCLQNQIGRSYRKLDTSGHRVVEVHQHSTWCKLTAVAKMKLSSRQDYEITLLKFRSVVRKRAWKNRKALPSSTLDCFEGLWRPVSGGRTASCLVLGSSAHAFSLDLKTNVTECYVTSRIVPRPHIRPFYESMTSHMKNMVP